MQCAIVCKVLCGNELDRSIVTTNIVRCKMHGGILDVVYVVGTNIP